jgi:DNA polymerase/3'-5' exonuclease PolX
MFKFNQMVADRLSHIADLEEDQWKARAYAMASIKIRDYHKNLEVMVDYKEIPGIGKSISEKIEEFRITGKIQKLEDYLHQAGVDPEYYYPEVVSAKKRTGKSDIKYPRKVISEKLSLFVRTAHSAHLKFKLAGSLRRRKEYVGDVDILILDEEIEIWGEFIRAFGGQIMSAGNKAIDAIWQELPLNFRVATKDAWEAGLLFFTGSKNLNISMRSKAKKMGMKLNQYGLWKDERRIAVSERVIFGELSIPYITPCNR